MNLKNNKVVRPFSKYMRRTKEMPFKQMNANNVLINRGIIFYSDNTPWHYTAEKMPFLTMDAFGINKDILIKYYGGTLL